jgi:uncharacterized lipoprotein
VKKTGFIVCIVMALSACSKYSSNGENLYLRSQNGANLEVPSPLTSSNISHFYDLPQQNADARVSINPPGE